MRYSLKQIKEIVEKVCISLAYQKKGKNLVRCNIDHRLIIPRVVIELSTYSDTGE